MKDFLKKGLILMASFFMTAGVVTPLTVKAESTPVIVDTPYGLNPDVTTEWTVGMTRPSSAGVYYDCYARFYINGQKVYCVEPMHQVVEGATSYDVTDLDYFTGSAETSRIVKWVSALGYGYGGDYSEEMDFATQIRIWQEIEPGLITDIHPAIQAKIDEINSRLAVVQTTVSFDGQTIELNGFGRENSVTLTDTTGTFFAYSLSDYWSQGLHFEKDGNSLTIWAEESDFTDDAVLWFSAYEHEQHGTAIAYWSPYSQGLAYLDGVDPYWTGVYANFTIAMTPNKIDSETNGIAQGDASFGGTTFTVTDTTTGEGVGELVVGADGTASALEGLAPNHGYSLHETAAGNGYMANPLDIAFSAEEIAGMVDEGRVVLDIPNDVIKGSFKVAKYDNETGAQPQGNATNLKASFELYNRSANPVVVNGVEYAKDALITTFDTNNAGNYTYGGQLPYGTYEIIEITPPNGYQNTGTTKQTFAIRENGAVVDLSKYHETSIDNDVAKGGFELSKNDSVTGSSPQGDATDLTATFELYNRSTNPVVVNGKEYAKNDLIMTFKTDATGKYSCDNLLPFGTYEIVEVTPPKGYLNAGAKQTITIGVDTQNSVDIFDEVIKGSFKITKYDNETKTAPQGDATNLKASFELYNRSANPVVVNGVEYAKNALITTFETNNAGNYTYNGQLPYGTYEVVEVTPPTGYQLEGTTKQTFTIRENNEVADLTKFHKTSIDNDVIRGGFKLNKYDKDIETRPQGDAPGLAATFELYNRSTNPVVVNGTEYAKDALIMTFKTNKAGKYSCDDVLPYGTYEVIEVAPPEGYLNTGTTKQTFSVRENHGVADLTKFHDTAIENDVIVGDFDLYKVLFEADKPSVGVPEEGVHFAAILKSYVDEVHGGDFDAALAAAPNDLTAKEYDPDMVTNAEGYAKSRKLAYGTYMVKQTKSSDDEIAMLYEPFYFEVTKKNQPTKMYHISNVAQTYKVKITKTDKETGETVTLNSATFQLTNDETGEALRQKVGLWYKDEFKTAAQKASGYAGVNVFFDPDNPFGVVATPDAVEAGKYTVFETEIPDGFLELEKPIKLNVKKTYVAEVDPEDGELYIDIKAVNDQPRGKLIINKSIEDFESDTSFINRENLSGIQFSIFAAKDIISPIDGSLLYAAGELYGTYNCEKDGSLVVDHIPMGEYKVKETAVPNGIILDKTEYSMVFKQKDTTTKEYTYEISPVNKTTKLEVSKKAVTGDDELEGAALSVVDSKGNEVDSWISGDKPHIIEGLKVGETYTLTEDLAPLGYAKASSIEFKVNEDGTVTNVTMIDKIVTLSKTDVGGEEVPGAQMTVTDKETGEAVDEWISGDEAHQIENLEVGRTYILHEDTAPAGFVKATEQEFTVLDDGADQHEKMIDKIVTITKTDATDSEELPGAELRVTDKETGEEIDKWTSGDAPHQISGLEEGRTYILYEDLAPLGYAKASDIEFFVEGADEDGLKTDQTVHMVDKVVELSKVDVGGEEVPGAEMKVTDKETGEEVDHWTSTDEPHKIENLEVGKTYILHEDTAPAGYVKATDQEFTVLDDGVDQHEEMVDKIVDLSKVEIDGGEELPGAEITITDKESGEVVDEWTSTDEPHRIENLEVGKTYIFHEEGAPDGHYYAADTEFFVEDDKTDMHLEIVDAPIEYEIYKIDNRTGDIVPGVTLELLDLDAEEPDEGKEGAMVDGFPVITTDEPIELGSQLIAGHRYKLTETEWVKGVHKAVSLEFIVDVYAPAADEEGIIQPVVITMVDEFNALSFQKVDDNGKPLAGAEFQILEATYDENGKAVPKLDDEGNPIIAAEFVSNDKPEGVAIDKNGVELASLLKGDDRDDETTGEDTDAVYLLHEAKAPFGYEPMAEDMPFTVTGTDEFPQVIRVTNKRQHFFVSAVKVDASDKTKMLKGAEITIFNAKTNEIAKTVDGKDAKGITDGRGVYMFELAYSEDGYYAMETGAPTGYLLNKDKHEVKLSEDYNFAKDNPIVIVVADTPQSKTAAGAPVVAGGMGVAAMAALAVLYVTRRKEDDAEANANA